MRAYRPYRIHMSIAVCLAASLWLSGCGGSSSDEPETVPLDDGAHATAAKGGEGSVLPAGGEYALPPLVPVSVQMPAETQSEEPAAPVYTAAVGGGGAVASTPPPPSGTPQP